MIKKCFTKSDTFRRAVIDFLEKPLVNVLLKHMKNYRTFDFGKTSSLSDGIYLLKTPPSLPPTHTHHGIHKIYYLYRLTVCFVSVFMCRAMFYSIKNK